MVPFSLKTHVTARAGVARIIKSEITITKRRSRFFTTNSPLVHSLTAGKYQCRATIGRMSGGVKSSETRSCGCAGCH